MKELISKQEAIDVAEGIWYITGDKNVAKVLDGLKNLCPAQQTFYGYNLKHLVLIAFLLDELCSRGERKTE